jgi:uncharacterized protein YehS (DUF1456 family)
MPIIQPKLPPSPLQEAAHFPTAENLPTHTQKIAKTVLSQGHHFVETKTPTNTSVLQTASAITDNTIIQMIKDRGINTAETSFPSDEPSRPVAINASVKTMSSALLTYAFKQAGTNTPSFNNFTEIDKHPAFVNPQTGITVIGNVEKTDTLPKQPKTTFTLSSQETSAIFRQAVNQTSQTLLDMSSLEDKARILAGEKFSKVILSQLHELKNTTLAYATARIAHDQLLAMAPEYNQESLPFFIEHAIQGGRFALLANERPIFIMQPHASIAEILELLKTSNPSLHTIVQANGFDVMSEEEAEEVLKANEPLKTEFQKLFEAILQEILIALQMQTKGKEQPPANAQQKQKNSNQPIVVKKTSTQQKIVASQVDTMGKSLQAHKETREWKANFQKLLHTLTIEQKQYIEESLHFFAEQAHKIRHSILTESIKSEERRQQESN